MRAAGIEIVPELGAPLALLLAAQRQIRLSIIPTESGKVIPGIGLQAIHGLHDKPRRTAPSQA